MSILFQVESITRSLKSSRRKFVFSASLRMSLQTLSPSQMNWSCLKISITNSSRSRRSISVTLSFSERRSRSFFWITVSYSIIFFLNKSFFSAFAYWNSSYMTSVKSFMSLGAIGITSGRMDISSDAWGVWAFLGNSLSSIETTRIDPSTPAT